MSHQPRLIQPSDYHLGLLTLLSQLTTVGQISETQFLQQLKDINSNPNHLIYVIPDSPTNPQKIIASGTLLIEPKLIHQCSRIGHIEDIVVDQNYRGHGLGRIIINHLIQQAKLAGCYKIILDCHQDNVPFYEKCGFQPKEIEMALYFE